MTSIGTGSNLRRTVIQTLRNFCSGKPVVQIQLTRLLEVMVAHVVLCSFSQAILLPYKGLQESVPTPRRKEMQFLAPHNLCNKLNLPTGLLDLALRLFADISRLHNDGDFRQTACTEELRVSEGKEVDDRRGVQFRAVVQVLCSHLFRHECPELSVAPSVVAQSKLHVSLTLLILTDGFHCVFRSR